MIMVLKVKFAQLLWLIKIQKKPTYIRYKYAVFLFLAISVPSFPFISF